MQRITVAGIAAVALSAVLLTGCAEECPNTQPMYFNSEDGHYHYENVGGPLVPDNEVRAGCGADQQGDDADGHRIKTPSKAKPRNATKTRR